MRVRKAVVPAAGLGTRLFPASHAVKKELFPIVGRDGVARALLHYHVIDLLDAGLEEICFIVQPGDEAVIRAYFTTPDAAYLRRLEKYPSLYAEARSLSQLGERLRFAVQHEQEGYGHAVYQSAPFAAGEPVLLCLGDHLFRGASTSCAAQLLAAFAKDPTYSISAVNRIGPAQLRSYGTIAGRRWPAAPHLIDVSLIIEKPNEATAREHLRVDGLGPDEFLGWFGMHLLRPSIYEVLDGMIRDEVRDQGEFQLTRAQELLRQREGYRALEIQGKRYDFGLPADFVESVSAFASAP